MAELRSPDALLTLAARAVAPRLTQRDVSVLPTDLWEVLQRYMYKKRQIELFSDYKEYYETGQLYQHTHYKDCRKHGEDKEYYMDGQLMWHDHYKDGKYHGESKWYYSNGQLRWHNHHKDDERHGFCKQYYGNGDLQRVTEWEDGVCIKDNLL